MSKELYLKIPKKLKYFLNQIKDQDPFLYDYMEQVYETIKDAEIPSNQELVQGSLPYISEEESILLAAEFLELCNPKYKEALLKDYKEGKIEFSPSKGSAVVGNVEKGKYKVIVNKNDTIMQAKELVHETFHRLNLNKYLMNRVFTETVSIAAELMFIDFLREKGYSEYDLNLVIQGRGLIYANNLEYLKIMLPLYLEQKDKGNVESDFYNQLVQEQQISPQNLKKKLFFVLKTEKHELSVYRHTMGYILAKTFLSNNPSLEDLTEISELLHDNQIAKFQRKVMGNNTLEEVHKFTTKEDFAYHPPQLVKK